jgi:hemoglobin
MRLLAALTLCVVVTGIGWGAARADDPKPSDPKPADAKPAARTEADKRVAKGAVEVIGLGSDLYNRGNHEGCYRVYQGGLVALLPALDHRPKLAELVRDKLDKSKGMRPAEAAFAMREALDAVVAEAGGLKKVLWDRLGGEDGVRAVVREFLATAGKDSKVNLDRNGNYPLTKDRAERVERLLIEQISSVTGGPLKYTGRDMKNTHAGMKITEEEFAAAAGHLVAALKKLNVPQAEADDLLAIIATTKNDIVGK